MILETIREGKKIRRLLLEGEAGQHDIKVSECH